MPTDDSPTLAPKLVVVAPTFDNARTLRGLLDGVAALGLPTIVVDDGATDDTAAILAGWVGEAATSRWAIRHDVNRGKAAALATGFDRAGTLGFTHALTIDTDGQHDVADVPRLIAAHAADPRAIVVGARPTTAPGYPRKSRVGRYFSNLLVRIIGGVRVSDSQCGLRIYPLAATRAIAARTARYSFETEILARAGWANVPVVEVPIRCIYDVPTGRVTHFRPWRDSLDASAMHLRLLARSLALWPARKVEPPTDDTTTGTLVERTLRWINPMRTWRLFRRDLGERDRVAAAAGVGLFIGCQPAFGLKTLLCLGAAKGFRLSPLVTLGASSLTTPPVGLLVWTASIVVGHLLLHGEWPGDVRARFDGASAADVLRAVASEWLVGALLVGAAAGVIAWLIVRTVGRRMRDHEVADVDHDALLASSQRPA